MKNPLTALIAVAFSATAFGVWAAPLAGETSAHASTLQLDVKAKKKSGKKKTPKKNTAAKK